MVDYLGRTESEVEEEAELPEDVHMGDGDSDEEGEEDWRDASEHGGEGQEGQLQVMSNWLLELFTKWGRVLGVGGAKGTKTGGSDAGGGDGDGETTEDEGGLVSGLKSGRKGKEMEGTAGIGSVALRSRGQENGHLPRHRLSTVGEEEEDVSLSSTASA